jgi:hypothetical protein
MASQNYTQLLLEKIKALPPDKISEVEDFVDFLNNRPTHASATEQERLRIAIEAGLITPPEAGHKPSSVTDTPPVCIPGKPLSEIVTEDRR